MDNQLTDLSARLFGVEKALETFNKNLTSRNNFEEGVYGRGVSPSDDRVSTSFPKADFQLGRINREFNYNDTQTKVLFQTSINVKRIRVDIVLGSGSATSRTSWLVSFGYSKADFSVFETQVGGIDYDFSQLPNTLIYSNVNGIEGTAVNANAGRTQALDIPCNFSMVHILPIWTIDSATNTYRISATQTSIASVAFMGF